jgi:hypothetical protein
MISEGLNHTGPLSLQEDKELLGPVFHWSGESRSATYEEVKRRNQRLPQEQLRRLLERAVSIPDAEEVAPPAGDGAKKPGAPVGNDGLKGIHVNSVLRPVTSVRATRVSGHPCLLALTRCDLRT